MDRIASESAEALKKRNAKPKSELYNIYDVKMKLKQRMDNLP